MDADVLAQEIKTRRERLREIADERQLLDAEDFAGKTKLLDEEHRIEAELQDLRDQAADLGAGIAETQVTDTADPDRIPDIPEQG